MNQPSSTDSTRLPSRDPDAVSRRAYEIWENEGRPEGCDLKHWLQAEQEVATPQAENVVDRVTGTFSEPSSDSDIRPLQGTRAAAAAGRENKRGSRSPFGNEKNPTMNGGQAAARRKSSNTPIL